MVVGQIIAVGPNYGPFWVNILYFGLYNFNARLENMPLIFGDMVWLPQTGHHTQQRRRKNVLGPFVHNDNAML